MSHTEAHTTLRADIPLCRILTRDDANPALLYVSRAVRSDGEQPTSMQAMYFLAHLADEAGPMDPLPYGSRPAST